MEIFLLFVILAILIDVEEKLRKMQVKEKSNHLDLSNYLNKDVYIVLNNDNATDSYLFSSMMKTVGKIIDYDDTWFIFSYYNKNARKNITQYLKIIDLKSINEIRTNVK